MWVFPQSLEYINNFLYMLERVQCLLTGIKNNSYLSYSFILSMFFLLGLTLQLSAMVLLLFFPNRRLDLNWIVIKKKYRQKVYWPLRPLILSAIFTGSLLYYKFVIVCFFCFMSYLRCVKRPLIYMPVHACYTRTLEECDIKLVDDTDWLKGNFLDEALMSKYLFVVTGLERSKI